MNVCFLRGINVNGIKINNKDLKNVFEDLGFWNVTPILQTGNVIYNTPLNLDEQKVAIEVALRNTFGYEAFVILRDGKHMQTLFDDYPFELNDIMQPYVIFVNKEMIMQDLMSLPLDDNEYIQRGESIVYWTVPKGMTLDSKFGKALGKRIYKSETTSRNLRTIEKIVAKLNEK
ncbi:DUF1697 domain-containing protein [Macrococcus sp. EM39E]|uniref:DUF1697 domain-containing protein n=1 Tax=Macrococcus animalis TaxID=3395467 RepID=UPI0039BDC7F7